MNIPESQHPSTPASLILASRSPQRQALLKQLGVEFTCKPANVDESVKRGETPLQYVTRIAVAKAKKIADENPGCVVLAADTPVICGRRILQTPEGEAEARAMLKLQSNRRVQIPTVVVAVDAAGKVHKLTAASWVKFKRLSESEIEAHLAKPQVWKGRSGALEIESIGPWTVTMHGSYTGIIGLPLYETAVLLKRCGVL
jgi:septum formation protein